MVPIGAILLSTGFRFGGYCIGQGAGLDDIAWDRGQIGMILFGIGDRSGRYCCG